MYIEKHVLVRKMFTNMLNMTVLWGMKRPITIDLLERSCDADKRKTRGTQKGLIEKHIQVTEIRYK